MALWASGVIICFGSDEEPAGLPPQDGGWHAERLDTPRYLGVGMNEATSGSRPRRKKAGKLALSRNMYPPEAAGSAERRTRGCTLMSERSD